MDRHPELMLVFGNETLVPSTLLQVASAGERRNCALFSLCTLLDTLLKAYACDWRPAVRYGLRVP